MKTSGSRAPESANKCELVERSDGSKLAIVQYPVMRPVERVAIGFAACGLLAVISSCGGGGGGGPVNTGTGTGTTGGTTPPAITTKAQLGKAFFNDTTLSNPKGESCGTCHSENRAFTDPRPGPTSPGAVAGVFGFRHAPSIGYMAFSPNFSNTAGEQGGPLGGQFWDGHATDLADQAHFPMLNPFEMNNASVGAIVATVQAGPYAAALEKLYGATIFSNSTTAFNAIVDSIVKFEQTAEVSPFTSKYDAFLAGTVQLSAAETRGLAVFNGQGGCSGCHTSSPALDGTPPLFTNFCYANLGLPKNPNNPFYKDPASDNPQGANFIDYGVQRTTGQAAEAGMFMTPSLRNVVATPPYFHNGIYNTLQEVINFYNTRDIGNFPPPEVPANEDMTELGNLGLTQQNISDLVAFLNTLTDGYTATSPDYRPRR